MSFWLYPLIFYNFLLDRTPPYFLFRIIETSGCTALKAGRGGVMNGKEDKIFFFSGNLIFYSDLYRRGKFSSTAVRI